MAPPRLGRLIARAESNRRNVGMNFAHIDGDAQIALGFLAAIIVIAVGVFTFVFTRKSGR